MTQSKPNAEDRTRSEWTGGSYPAVGRQFLTMAARLVDAAGVGPGARVLDVACGTGNVALTAHRRGATVTGVDITPSMLELARERAAVIDAAVDWREGDAADLPFEDDAFEVTLSCLGHMFAADQDAAATELARVTESGGRVAFTAWTPRSGIAAMMGALSEHLPPQPDPSPPPVRWGDPDVVRGRFGDRVEDLSFETGVVNYPALSPAHFWAGMTTDSGPIIAALGEVEDGAREVVDAAVVGALGEYFSDAENAVELEYLLVTATVL